MAVMRRRTALVVVAKEPPFPTAWTTRTPVKDGVGAVTREDKDRWTPGAGLATITSGLEGLKMMDVCQSMRYSTGAVLQACNLPVPTRCLLFRSNKDGHKKVWDGYLMAMTLMSLGMGKTCFSTSGHR